jgi:hypothetical protein
MVPPVRGVFHGSVDEDVVEAAAAYFYNCVALRVFGPRFAHAMMLRMRARYRTAPSVDVERRTMRISDQVAAMERANEEANPGRPAQQRNAEYISSAIRAMFVESGLTEAEETTIAAAFPRAESAIERMKQHLEGIKRQNIWVMRGT